MGVSNGYDVVIQKFKKKIALFTGSCHQGIFVNNDEYLIQFSTNHENYHNLTEIFFQVHNLWGIYL